jgi:glycerol-3-phosphate O-acyltransferase/dihydroxyacetone phosphate acyltransferase
MEIKLVYRWLRKTSDFALEGFYSEVLIEGSENVPKDGPIIVYGDSTSLDSPWL